MKSQVIRIQKQLERIENQWKAYNKHLVNHQRRVIQENMFLSNSIVLHESIGTIKSKPFMDRLIDRRIELQDKLNKIS